MSTTQKTSHTHAVVFGRRVADCPRCQELASGAPAPRTLRAMTRHGWIVWSDARERHWTGQTIKRRHVQPGPKLEDWYQTFIYRGHAYRLRYVDGCFHPFVFRADQPPPAFV
jgi:hypothetical protein